MCLWQCNFGRRPQHMDTSPFSILTCDFVASIPEKVAFPALMQSSSGFQLCSGCFFHPSWSHLGPARFCSRLRFLLLLSLSCVTDQHIFLSWTVSVILLFLQPSYHQLPIALDPGAAAHLQCSVGVCQECWNKTQLCNSHSQPSWFNASCRCIAGIASLPLGNGVVLERGREKRGLYTCVL